jgi:hypothetical protein
MARRRGPLHRGRQPIEQVVELVGVHASAGLCDARDALPTLSGAMIARACD